MTAISRVLGLVREQVRSYYLGTSHASDAFGIAALLPNLLRRLFAEGAMTAAFIPVLADYRHRGDPRALNEFLSRFVTLFSVLMVLVTAAGIALSPWLVPLLFPGFTAVEGKTELTVALTLITWPYLLSVSLAAVAQALLNSYRIFAPSAFTPVLLNLTIIGTAVLFESFFPSPAHAFAWGFTLGGVAQLVFQIPFLRGRGLKVRLDFRAGPGVRRVAAIVIPGTFAAGIYQVNVLVSQFVATQLQPGSVSSLQFSVRLQELVLGLFAVSLTTVILPVMADQAAQGDRDGLKDTLRFGASLIAFVSVPATVGLILLATPIVRLLFEFGAFDARSTSMTAYAVIFHAAGIYPVAMSRVTTQAFYARKDLRTPTIVAAIVMVLHAVLCFALAEPLSHGGIALAGGLAAAIHTFLLWRVLRKQLGALGGRELAVSALKIGAASASMGAAVWGFVMAVPSAGIGSRPLLGLWVLAAVTIGVVVFFFTARWLQCPELTTVREFIARKRRKRNLEKSPSRGDTGDTSEE